MRLRQLSRHLKIVLFNYLTQVLDLIVIFYVKGRINDSDFLGGLRI